MIKELVQFLKVFEGLISSGSGHNFEMATELFACLNEMILNEPENQVKFSRKFSILRIFIIKKIKKNKKKSEINIYNFIIRWQ